MFKFEISPEFLNLDQILSSKSKQKFNFMTTEQLPNLHQTVVNMSLSINISNRKTATSFELASSHTRVTSIKCTKQMLVNQSVSY